MAREFEIIGAGAIGALLHRKAKHGPAPGAVCANCGTELAGPYCHACGQDADDHHRSIGHLAWEGIEGLTHLDGRLAQTLPLLLFRPGRLARDHMEGRRARHVPPFRLFLISLLVFTFVLEAQFHSKTGASGGQQVRISDGVNVSQVGGPSGVKPDDINVRIDTDTKTSSPGGKHPNQNNALGVWMREHIARAVANPDFYRMVLFTWAHRLAILLLPILAGLLALTYVRRRQFFVYDHLIVAMQFLSFEFLVFALVWPMPDPISDWVVLAAIVWSPINLYMTLRGAYGSGRITAALKTLFLWFSTLVLFGTLMLGLMALALAEM